jgi:hypothetical protein
METARAFNPFLVAKSEKLKKLIEKEGVANSPKLFFYELTRYLLIYPRLQIIVKIKSTNMRGSFVERFINNLNCPVGSHHGCDVIQDLGAFRFN